MSLGAPGSRRVILGPLLFTGAVFSAAGACASDVPPPHVMEWDSAGIRIVESSPPYPEWRLASTPVLRIGVVEGDPAYQLHNVHFAGRLDDGGVALLDGGTMEVRWYDAHGVHRASAGRRGEGPGEFRATLPSATVIGRDTLVVYDGGNSRLTWLASDGTIARETPVPGVHGDVRVLGAGSGGHVLLSESKTTYTFDGRSYNYSRDTVTVLAVGRDGRDTIARFQAAKLRSGSATVTGSPSRPWRCSFPSDTP